MKQLKLEEVYWKNKDESTVLLVDMTEEQLQESYLTIHKRQVFAYSSLELCHKMETSIVKIAKQKQIELIPLDQSNNKKFFRLSYEGFKGIITRINNSIKLKINKDVKDQALLQDSDS